MAKKSFFSKISKTVKGLGKSLSKKKGKGARTKSLFVPTVNKRWVH